MSETPGLFHFYVEESGQDEAGLSVHRAHQLDDEDAALMQEGTTILLGDCGPWCHTEEEAIMALLEMQLEAGGE